MYPQRRPWQAVWAAFMNQWSTETLWALAEALMADAEEIIQTTTTWPFFASTTDVNHPVEACCPVAWCCRRERGLSTLIEVETAFGEACFTADQTIGEVGGTRWFVNFWDDAPRAVAFRLLLAEVQAELAQRAVKASVGFGGSVWAVSAN